VPLISKVTLDTGETEKEGGLNRVLKRKIRRTVNGNEKNTKVICNAYPTLSVNLSLSRKAFSFTAPTVWNYLSLSTRSAVTFDSFKSLLKTELFGIAFPDVPQ